jgi:hypothetical protein
LQGISLAWVQRQKLWPEWTLGLQHIHPKRQEMSPLSDHFRGARRLQLDQDSVGYGNPNVESPEERVEADL